MIKYFTLATLCIFLFTACSNKMLIEPTVSKNLITTKQIKANLIGKKTFLPNIITKDEYSLINIDYSINETYNINGKNSDIINLFNPLLFVGFPLGDNLFFINANLKIIKNNRVIKDYNAKCLHTYTRNLFGNPNFTSMRNECLEEIKDNLNSQIINHIEKGELNEI
ncbi:hypothetical protein AVENP_1106 [Arcobacter venerupis]|uniref:Lipoprotein n=1 Tax=Arcobacter venerupis TaxID=1054033 RepID=A0AAE7B7T1_9BACT|nr:hypothetical protein [Arcobacter venerupis]QKF66661.1 hypothetical protein AVENP_1106 [Arcobacter venerupis]RWS49608.1 hypothetical protein CKA56_07750 [Arcobacter venerupis]